MRLAVKGYPSLSSFDAEETDLPDPADFDPDLFGQRVALTLPSECAAGVAQNVALLDDHWTLLRAALTDDDAA